MLMKKINKLGLRLSSIVAMDKNNAIGKENKIPWRLSSDLKHFKEKTMGYHMIMGRKTYESIGKPLPGRMTIILTKDLAYTALGSIVVHSIEEAIDACPKGEEIFIVGGQAIYEAFFPYTHLIYLTQVETEIVGADTHFPTLSLEDWVLLREREQEQTEKDDCKFTFQTFMRKDLISKNIDFTKV